MIIFFTASSHGLTLDGLLRSPYRKAKVKVMSYDWLFNQSGIHTATCIFTDFDRLNHFRLVKAAIAYQQLQEGGVRVLNDPARCCQRRELLFRLHKAGINRFRAYPAALDPMPSRFPVLLKCESTHSQEIRELFYDQISLDKKLAELRASGFPLHYMLVIEFANRQHRENVYRRYTIYRIGDRMVPANPVTEADPFVKYGTPGLATDADLNESATEIMENPHADLMRRVFDIAEIEYGRADFGFDGNTPAVYEINTNPTIGLTVPNATGSFANAVQHSMRMIAEAVDALDGQNKFVPLHYPSKKNPKKSFYMRRFLRKLLLKQP